MFDQIFHCNNCGHDNEDLSEDEDGDLVCEECGHVIQPPAPATPAPKGVSTVHTCHQCGEENYDLEPDEDGDLVCQECGHVIPEEQGEEEVSHGNMFHISLVRGQSHINRLSSKRMMNQKERSLTNALIAGTLPLIPNQTMRGTGFAKNVDAYYPKSTAVFAKVVGMKISIQHAMKMVSTSVRIVVMNWK